MKTPKIARDPNISALLWVFFFGGAVPKRNYRRLSEFGEPSHSGRSTFVPNVVNPLSFLR